MKKKPCISSLFFCLILFPSLLWSADFYWVNGSGNWTDFANHWATSSGGTIFHDSIPGPNDRVFIDGNSFSANNESLNIDTSRAVCLSIDFTGISVSPIITGLAGDTLNVGDDFILENSLTWNYPGLLIFENRVDGGASAQNDTADIYLRGIGLSNDCIFNGQGIWRWQDDFKTTENIFFEQGSIIALGDSLVTGTFQTRDPIDTSLNIGATVALNRSVELGNASVRILQAGSSWLIQGSATTLLATQANISFDTASGDTLYFRSDSSNGKIGQVNLPPAPVVIERGAQIGNLALLPGSELLLGTDPGAPLIVDNLSGSGDCGNYILIRSLLPGIRAQLRALLPASSLSYVRIQDIALSDNPIVLTQSLDDGKLSGPWSIGEPLSATSFYWVNEGGNWTDPGQWSLNSGGLPGNCIPGPRDTVIFDANSFSLPNQVVFLYENAYCAGVEAAAIDEFARMEGDASLWEIRGSMALSSRWTFNFTGKTTFTGNGSLELDQVFFPGNIDIEGSSYTLVDSLLTGRQLSLTSGDFNASNKYIQAQKLLREDGGGFLNLSNAEILLNGSDTVWRSKGSSLGNIDAGGASFRLIDPDQLGAIFVGDGLDYGSLILENPYTELLGSNSFELIQLNPGNTLAIENATLQEVDSLQARGSCDSPVFLQSISQGDSAALIRKTSFPSLLVDHAYISQLRADTMGGRSYLGTNSLGFNDTAGWKLSGAGVGQDLYWIGSTGNWSDASNWSSTSGGTAGTCLPGVNDNVIFDANSFSSPNDTVFVDITAYFEDMRWTGLSQNPILFQYRDLSPGGDVILHPNLTWEKAGISQQTSFRPGGGKSIFRTQSLDLNTSLQLLAEGNTDTLELEGDLLLDTLSSIIITRGSFLTQDFDLRSGTFFLATLDPKDIELGASRIEVFFSWFILGIASGLDLDAGTSDIFLGGSGTQALFYGNGETYNNLTLLPTEGDITLMNGNNTFEDLTLMAGAKVALPSGGNQRINGDFSALGTCRDSIDLEVQFPGGIGSVIDVSNTSQLEGECLNIKDIDLEENGGLGGFQVLFSRNLGNTSGFIFSNSPATSASFVAPSEICVEDSVDFQSTATAISGNANDLDYNWDFGDGDSSFVRNPRHKYASGGSYPVSLTSTYLNGCSAGAEDTLIVSEPSISLNTSEPNFRFCEGKSVSLRVSDSTLSDYSFFINGNSIYTGPDHEIQSTQIQDGDEVYATAMVAGCLAVSDTLTFEVIPAPTIQLSYLGASTIVCESDTLSFVASGGDLYEWFIDRVSQNFPFSDSSFRTTSIQDKQSVRVRVQDLSTGCSALSDDSIEFTVLPLPNLSLLSSDADRIICQGESVTFTASGAFAYEYFIDGVSQTPVSINTSFTTTSIQNSSIVSVGGSLQGCQTEVSLAPFTVNPTPNTQISASDPDTSICQGDQVNFVLSGAGAYQFLVNGNPLGNISGNNIYNSDSIRDGDLIRGIGFLGNCSDTTGAFDFEVRDLPLVNLNRLGNDSICAGELLTFSANGADDYQFFVDGNALGPFSPNSTLTLNNLQTGELVSVRGLTNGCSASAPQTYAQVVKALPQPNLFKITPGTSFCEGEGVSFAGLGAEEYEFFVNGVSQGGPSPSNQIVLDNLPPGNVEISLKGYSGGCEGISSDTIDLQVIVLPQVMLSSPNNSPICQGDTVGVQASGATFYQWLLDGSPLGGQGAGNTIFLPNLQSGQSIQAIGTLNGCADTSTNALNFVVDPLPATSLTVSDPDLIVCEGESLTFTSSGADQYQFFVDGVPVGPPSNLGQYQTDSLQNQQVVSVSGFLGNCQADAPNTLTLIVNPLPQVGISSSDPDTSICEGVSVSINGSGASTYEFLLDGLSLAPPGPVSQLILPNLSDGQQISVIGYSAQNCADTSDALTFKVLPSPTVGLMANDNNDRLCKGDTLVFSASGAGSYEFFVDGNSVQGPSSNPVYATDSLRQNQLVEVLGSLGRCSTMGDSSYSFQVDTRPNPRLTLVGESEICAGETLILNASGAPEFQFLLNGNPFGGISFNGQLAISTISDGEVISVEGLNGDCVVSGDTSFQIQVNDFPFQVNLLSSDPDLRVCFQDSIELSASGAVVYEFSVNGIPVAGPDSSATFRVSELEDGDEITVRGAFGDCFTPSLDSLSFEVTKLDLDLRALPSNLICEGQSVQLLASGADRYEFFVEGLSQGSPGAAPQVSINKLNDGALAEVAGIDNGSGCRQRIQYPIHFRVLPNAIVAPQGPITLCEGEELWLTTPSQGRLQWFRNGVSLLGSNSDSLPIQESGIYTVALEQGGENEAWTVGKNAQGQLGDSSTIDRRFLEAAVESEEVRDVDGGEAFSLAALADGRVLAWGDNSFGQLGDGSFVDRREAREVPGINDAVEVSGGKLHSLVLLANGRVMAFGDNRSGQLGLGNNAVSNFPFEVSGLTDIRAISAGSRHSMALDRQGRLYTWGENSDGQLGDSSTRDSNLPLALDSSLVFQAIAAGDAHSLALGSDGKVYAWGNNALGQLGIDSLDFAFDPRLIALPEKIVDVAAGAFHSLFLGESGRLYVSGDNSQGQTGRGALGRSSRPTRIQGIPPGIGLFATPYQSFILLPDTSLYGCGRNVSGSLGNEDSNKLDRFTYLPLLTGAVDISGGLDHLLLRMGYGRFCESSEVEIEVKPAATVSISQEGQDLKVDDIGVDYRWFVNGNLLTNENGPLISPSIGGDYIAEVIFANGCSRLTPPFNFMPVYVLTDLENLIALYPNPAKDILKIEVSDGFAYLRALRIYDALGKSVVSQQFEKGLTVFQLEVHSLAAGMYQLEVSLSDGAVYRKKIQIRH